MGRRFLGRVSGRDCSSYLPGLYTVSELDQMIFVDGYIPVASTVDLVSMRSAGSKTMGAGTCWEDTYSVSLTSKYVQVLAIDFTSFGAWSSSIGTFGGIVFTGIYDGNELAISNLVGSEGLFFAGQVTYVNMRVLNIDLYNASSTWLGGITSQTSGGTMTNCIVSGSIESYSNACGLFSTSILSKIYTGLHISDCHFIGTVKNNFANSSAAGIIINANGQSGISVLIEDCTVSGTINGETYAGGICVSSALSTIKNCTVSATIDGTINAAGICTSTGASANFENCINQSNVTAGTGYGAGVVNVSANNCTISDCKNYGDIYSAGTHVGGISTCIINSQTIERCYNSGDVGGSSQFTGGITTYLSNGGSVSKCVVENCTLTGGGGTNTPRVSGIAYFRIGTNFIEDCRVENVTFVNVSTSGVQYTATGGISCEMFQGKNIIRRCEVIGCDISGNIGAVGGILAHTRATSTGNEVNDCRVIDTVINGTYRTGGIAGSLDQNTDRINNCYSNAEVTGTGAVGGAVGYSAGSAAANDSYWDTVVSGNPTSAKGVGKTTSDLQTPTSATGIYSAWDALIWDFGTSSDYPKLINTP